MECGQFVALWDSLAVDQRRVSCPSCLTLLNPNYKEDAILALREVIVKTWPDVPTNEALQKPSGLSKSRVMMYRSSISRRSDVSKDKIAGNPIQSGRTEKEGDIGNG